MAERSLAALTLVAALGSAVSGGVLFAFSAFVVAALARLPAQQGIAAMQAINVTVINVPFIATFYGTDVVCLVLSGAAVAQRGWSGGLVVAASLFYGLGCLAVTMTFNVPLNDALENRRTFAGSVFFPVDAPAGLDPLESLTNRSGGGGVAGADVDASPGNSFRSFAQRVRRTP